MLRSVVISGPPLWILPMFLELTGALIAMPLSELIVAVIAAASIKRAQLKK